VRCGPAALAAMFRVEVDAPLLGQALQACLQHHMTDSSSSSEGSSASDLGACSASTAAAVHEAAITVQLLRSLTGEVGWLQHLTLTPLPCSCCWHATLCAHKRSLSVHPCVCVRARMCCQRRCWAL
jgi:hypothetical protein